MNLSCASDLKGEPATVLAACERMAGRKRHDHRLFDQRQHPDAGGLADCGADEGDVDAAGLRAPISPGVLFCSNWIFTCGLARRNDRIACGGNG